jgi:hypothetical protein
LVLVVACKALSSTVANLLQEYIQFNNGSDKKIKGLQQPVLMESVTTAVLGIILTFFISLLLRSMGRIYINQWINDDLMWYIQYPPSAHQFCLYAELSDHRNLTLYIKAFGAQKY